MKIRHYLLFMTIVSLVGAFSLLYFAWLHMSQSSNETDRFSLFLQSSGEASATWKKATKLSDESKEVISRMDYFADEPSILFQFVGQEDELAVFCRHKAKSDCEAGQKTERPQIVTRLNSSNLFEFG